MSPFETGESHFLKLGAGGGNVESCGVAERLLGSTEGFGELQVEQRGFVCMWALLGVSVLFLQEDGKTRCKLELSAGMQLLQPHPTGLGRI